MKRALVTRCGAFGDMIIVSPVFRKLKELGYKVYVHTGDRGLQVLKHNPYIDEFIRYDKEGVDNPNIQKDWDSVKERVNPDWHRNFSESIEVSLALHARSPLYIYPKEERRKKCDKNYYDYTARWANLDLLRDGRILPELYYSEEELSETGNHVEEGMFNIMWCLSGSGMNKAYPWVDFVMGEILKEFSDVRFITVGDERCQMIETLKDQRIENLSGQMDYRDTMALTRAVDLVVAPDTGILHASGATHTPKIGLLGHSTINNITKYFHNDYSIESDPEMAECSPCFHLIYDHKIQCPIDHLNGAAWCMSQGIPPKKVVEQIKKVLKEHVRKEDNVTEAAMSCM